MAAVSLGYHHVKAKMSTWTIEDMDAVLEIGDANFIAISGSTGTDVLMPYDISNLLIQDTHVSINIMNTFSGNMETALSDLNTHNFTLIYAFEKASEENKYFIFTVGNAKFAYAISVVHDNTIYFCFDSHKRGLDGLPSANGSAVVTKHSSMPTLVDFLRHLTSSLGFTSPPVYELVSVAISQDFASEMSDEQLLKEVISIEHAHGVMDPDQENSLGFSPNCQWLKEPSPTLGDDMESLLHSVVQANATLASDWDDQPLSTLLTSGTTANNPSPNIFFPSSPCPFSPEVTQEFDDSDDEPLANIVRKISSKKEVTNVNQQRETDTNSEISADLDDGDHDDDDYLPCDDSLPSSSENDDGITVSKTTTQTAGNMAPEVAGHVPDIPIPRSSSEQAVSICPIIEPMSVTNYNALECSLIKSASSVAATEVSPGSSLAANPVPAFNDKGRKRRRNPASWKCNINKTKRNSGQAYTTKSGKQAKAREMGKGCGTNCRKKCHERFSDETRQNIFHSFWRLSSLAPQRDFIVHQVQEKAKEMIETSRRKRTLKWYLPIDENQKLEVCKTFFLDTLNVSDSVVYTALDKRNSIGTVKEDLRGRSANRRNVQPEKEHVIEHINSFPRMPSHYCRKDTNKEYLSPDLNLEKIYHLYASNREKQGCKPVGKTTYKMIFYNEFNLAFHVLSKDRCDFCAGYENADEHERSERKDAYDQHLADKDAARRKKDADKAKAKADTSLAACCFDLEQIFPTPQSTEKILYYKRKLSCFNFTIMDYGSETGYCFLWDETIANRGACEIGSCIWKYLKEQSKAGKKHVSLFSDSCGGQNRNRHIMALLWYAAHKLNFESIEHTFFIPGHSQNECDLMHRNIESAKRGIKVFTPSQWAAIVRTARRNPKPFEVFEMDTEDFVDLKSLSTKISNFDTDINKDKVHWLKMRRYKIDKAEPSLVRIYYDYTENFITLDMSRRARKVYDLPNPAVTDLKKLFTEKIPLDKKKYTDLVALCDAKIIPHTYHEFYKSLTFVE